MRRADVLRLTAISEQAFDALSHRRLLPIEPQRREAKGWANYRASDLLKLDLVLALSKRGCDQAIANVLVRDGFDFIRDVAQANSQGDIHFGCTEIESFAPSYDDLGREEIVSTSTRIPFAARERDVAFEAQHALLGSHGALVSILTVNVSQRLRVIRARAELRPNAEALSRELAAIWVEGAP